MRRAVVEKDGQGVQLLRQLPGVEQEDLAVAIVAVGLRPRPGRHAVDKEGRARSLDGAVPCVGPSDLHRDGLVRVE